MEDVRNEAFVDGKHAVSMNVWRQPGINIIETVGRIKDLLPELRASIPPTISLQTVGDRTTTIRASVNEIEFTLMLTIALVVMVIFLFLRNVWATAIPSIAVPLSIAGTFGVMILLGYSMDNLSLMALAISTGFVVDDAIVVIENIARYLEAGYSPMAAALEGSREIGSTVVSMSTSLMAVFIPLLLMGGTIGRLFREFAVTLCAAIAVSLCVSLTTTPMMCARFLKPASGQRPAWLAISRHRTSLPIHTPCVCRGPALGFAAPAVHAVPHGNDHLSERVSIYCHSKGFLPATGYRPDCRDVFGFAGCFPSLLWKGS